MKICNCINNNGKKGETIQEGLTPYSYNVDPNENYTILYRCPVCGKSFYFFPFNGKRYPYCCYCGTKINWNNVPEFLNSEQTKEFKALHLDKKWWSNDENPVLKEFLKKRIMSLYEKSSN